MNIIIIGAGVSGLMAATQLSGAEHTIKILEGDNRIGGRIKTIDEPGFDTHLELGAEFIHGKLPVTLNLLKEAGIEVLKLDGQMMNVVGGKWHEQEEPLEDWDWAIKQMQKVKEDISIKEFFQQYLNDEKYDRLKDSLRHYAEGFDVASIDDVSTIALRTEWMEQEEEMYRVKGGYSSLVNYLADECKKNKVEIITSCIIKKIEWKQNDVKVVAADGSVFTANKVIVTIPLGVLQGDDNNKASLVFQPPVTNYLTAFKKMGYGSCIKIFLQFDNPFWEKHSKKVELILSNQPIPTWWTQYPNKSNLLTGWLGGPNAKALKNAEEDVILKLALDSLANIFNIDIEQLRNHLKAKKIIDWSAQPFSLGCYSYPSVETNSAKETIKNPIDDTVFFTGEGVYNGATGGTVEAALISGKNIALTIKACNAEVILPQKE